MRTPQELQALENAAWASPSLRSLYSTRHVPGFPWHTVCEAQNSDARSSPVATAAPSSLSPLPAVSVRRHVLPYDFQFSVFVKGRWVGRRLLDVYTEELPHHTPDYYDACLRSGRLYCVRRTSRGGHNTQRRAVKREPTRTAPHPPAAGPRDVPAETLPSTALAGSTLVAAPASCDSQPVEDRNVVLSHGDVVYHTVHRHEVPVTVGMSGVDPVCITAVRIRKYGLLCVNKPTGLPTHATGRYMYNSLTALLEYVLAPKRLRAWLTEEDPLLQSLVSTANLTAEERQELLDYYTPVAPPHHFHHPSGGDDDAEAEETAGDVEEVSLEKLPRPCHRLDKVTSGVLLLAVNSEAAKRIGTMLMQKAREVDDAVSAELPMGAAGGDPSTEESTLPSSLSSSSLSRIRRLVGHTYELQKFYLARVVDSPIRSGCDDGSNVWVLDGSEECLREHNAVVRGLLASAPAIAVADADTAIDSSVASLSSMRNFPSGVLVTAPLFTHGPGASVKGAASAKAEESRGVEREEEEAGPSSARRRKPASATPSTATAAAATLCQRLSTLTVASPADTSATLPSGRQDEEHKASSRESVVLCTPYTGRLHQIRSHLSTLGFPIVGDVVYAHGKEGNGQEPPPPQQKGTSGVVLAEALDTAPDASAAGQGEEADEPAWTRNERDYVYYDKTKLPAAYLALCDSRRGGEGAAEESATPGLKRSRIDGASAALPSSLASPHESGEVLCYECAGRLPIVATKECATSTSAVCLHAWAYEIKESLLLLLLRTEAEEGSAGSRNSSEGSKAAECDEGRDTLLGEEAASARGGGVQQRGEGFVRFEAPPPSWAYPPLL